MSEGTPAPAEDAARILRHDLRTPINHIVGYAELLLDDADDPALVEMLRAVDAEAQAALGLIDQITDAEMLSRHGPALVTSTRDILDRLAPFRRRTTGDLAADLEKIESAARALLVLAGGEQRPYAASSAQPDAPAGSGSLLVVDDNEMNRDMLARRLTRLGYTVESVENGRQALDRLAAGKVDLMLLDVMMPEMDGYAVLEQCRQDDALREIPVIVLSALSEVDSIVRCIELGADDYLPKPFNSVLLRARIEACLERKRRRDAEVAELAAVNCLTEAAAAIEAGDFQAASLADVAVRDDPLGQLARVLGRMAAALQEREETLRARLRDRSYVFLSYARDDRDRVEAILAALTAAGVRVWLDRHDLAGGASWAAQIVQSIRGCAAILVACSPAALASRNVRQEILLAWKHGRPYVPLILEPVDFPDEVAYHLEGWQWVDIGDGPPDAWLPPLLHALRRLDIEPLPQASINEGANS